MANRPLYGPRVNYGSTDAQRQQLMAQQLLNAGVSTAPVQGGWGEALARIGTAGIGGYLSNQAGETEKAYQKDRASTLARALSAGQDQTNLPGPNPDGSAGYNQPGDPNRMAAILMGNPSTADLGAQLSIGNMEFNRNRSAQKEDKADERQYQAGVRQENRGWQVEDLNKNQQFQKDLMGIQQAFATGQLNAQQAFAARQAAETRAFQQSENALNREAQTKAAEPTRILTGLKIQEEQQKVQDNEKAKQESKVSVDRMIRSIDELANHPGLEGTVGFSLGQRHIPGTDAASFDARLETLKSQAFLPMVAQLKGMGQLSDAEGKKLTAAIGALDPRMSEKEFKASLETVRSDMNAALERMGGKPIPKPGAAGTPGASGDLPALPPGFKPLP